MTWAAEKQANREAKARRRVERRFGTYRPLENPQPLPDHLNIIVSDLRPSGTLLSCKCGAKEAVSHRGATEDGYVGRVKRFAKEHAACAEA